MKQGKKYRMVWADDQLDVAKSLSALLKPMGAEIVYSADGLDALSRARRQFFDVAIVDLRMPPGDWGGLVFLQQLREDGLEVPVVVLSGEGTRAETIKAMRLGASDYVTKDNVENELFEAVSQVLKRSLETVLKDTMLLPVVMALPFRRYEASPGSISKLHRLFEFYEFCLRYCCYVGIPECVRIGGKEAVDEVLCQLPRPSMGTWNAVRLMLAEKVDHCASFNWVHRAAQIVNIGRVIELRNDFAHGGEPSERKAQGLLEDLGMELHRFLKGLNQRPTPDLAYIEVFRCVQGQIEADGYQLSGPGPAFPRYERRVTRPVESGRVYSFGQHIDDIVELEPSLIAVAGENPASLDVLVFDGYKGYRPGGKVSGDEVLRYVDLQSGNRRVELDVERRLKEFFRE